MTLAQQLDAIWRQYQIKALRYALAAREIRRLVPVTVAGARSLLESTTPPSARYSPNRKG